MRLGVSGWCISISLGRSSAITHFDDAATFQIFTKKKHTKVMVIEHVN